MEQIQYIVGMKKTEIIQKKDGTYAVFLVHKKEKGIGIECKNENLLPCATFEEMQEKLNLYAISKGKKVYEY